ncbi:hypothetical protein [Pseudoalteromonas rubra]|nr:hypothetical protein [Pseudoalteromonas rubra]
MLFSFLWAILLLFLAVYGFFSGSICFPGFKGEGLCYFENGLYVIVFALFLGFINMMLPLVAYLDKKERGSFYVMIGNKLKIVCVVFIVIATAMAHGYL